MEEGSVVEETKVNGVVAAEAVEAKAADVVEMGSCPTGRCGFTAEVHPGWRGEDFGWWIWLKGFVSVDWRGGKIFLDCCESVSGFQRNPQWRG